MAISNENTPIKDNVKKEPKYCRLIPPRTGPMDRPSSDKLATPLYIPTLFLGVIRSISRLFNDQVNSWAKPKQMIPKIAITVENDQARSA